MDRRTFIASAGAAGAGALILGGVPVGAGARRRRGVFVAKTGSFPQGVGSGEPTTRGITLWTRLGGYNLDRKLFLEVSDDPGFGKVLYRRNVIARASTDHTVNVHLTRQKFLKPGEQLFYRFETRESHSPVGRFRLARPKDSREPVKIAFFSCQDWQAGYYGAHRTIAEIDDLDLVLCVGDYIYERNFYEGPRHDTLGANGDGEVQTLEEYRAKYQLYKGDANLQAMHAAHPFMGGIDDHEVEDNWAGDEEGEKVMDRRLPFERRRANGLDAWFEYMPFRRFRGLGNRTYRRFPLGRTAEVFIIDSRSHREDQPCGDQLFVPCPEAEDPGRAFLGREQKEWLKDGLTTSPASWKLVGNQLMMMSLDIGGAPANKDSWDGYGGERREILEHVAERGAQDIAFLTGDIHAFFAGEVGVDGRGPESVATDFVGGSISSLGVGETVEEASAPGTSGPANALAPGTVLSNNPHIKYAETSSRGYGLLTATEQDLQVELRGVDALRETGAEARTLARFRVERGNPRVEIL